MNISIRSNPRPKPECGDCAVATQIEIPFVIAGIHVVTPHVVLQPLQSFFTLAAANDFSNAGHEQIHCGYGFPIIVRPHIERFDLLREIENRDWTLEMFLSKPALVLRLQI